MDQEDKNCQRACANNKAASYDADDEVVRIKFLSHPLAGHWIGPIAKAFETRMKGAVKVEYVLVEFNQLFPDIVNEAASRVGLYDGFVTPPSIAGNVVEYNGWADLTSYIQESVEKTADWSDILLGYRQLIAQYEGKIIMYPLDGDLLTMYYRKDVLEEFGLRVPRTWEEYGDVAKATHGKVFKNQTMTGSCIGRVLGCAGSHWATLLLSSMTQTEGSWSGHLFDTADMNPLTGAAMEQALKWMETQVMYGASDEFEMCIKLNAEAMQDGSCVLSYNWGNTFKRHLEAGNKLKGGLMGVSKTPGSTKVLNRSTGKLVDCDEERCKHGDYYDDLGWVNRAPYLAFGGWACAVNNYATDNRKKRLMTEFCAFASSMEVSIDNIAPQANAGPNVTMNGQDPYRESHLQLEWYVRQGYERETAKEFLDVIRASLGSKNAVVENRFPKASAINRILEREFHTYLNATKHGLVPTEERFERRAAITRDITGQWETIIRDHDREYSNKAPILEAYQRLRGVYVGEKVSLNQLGNFRLFGFATVFIAVLVCAAFASWTIFFRKTRIVSSSQPLFLVMICIGGLVLTSTIILFGIDDGVASIEACSKACMAVPWLLTTGWVIVFSAIHSKLWRINKILKESSQFRRVHVSQRDMLLPFAALFLWNAVLLSIWTITDPVVWERVDRSLLDSYGKCSYSGSGLNSSVWVVCISLIGVTNGAALLLGIIEMFRARHVSTEYGESKYIGIALMCIVQVLLVGLPLMFLVEGSPTVRYFVKVSSVLITVMSIMLLVFVPKVYLLWKNPKGRKLDVSVGDRGLKIAVWKSEDLFQSIRQDMSMGRDSEFTEYKRKIKDLKLLLTADGVETEQLFRKAGFSETSKDAVSVRVRWDAEFSEVVDPYSDDRDFSSPGASLSHHRTHSLLQPKMDDKASATGQDHEIDGDTNACSQPDMGSLRIPPGLKAHADSIDRFKIAFAA